jgi:catechol 2,3-dioxygenase-like lactoylglutathione lyase family enzyme
MQDALAAAGQTARMNKSLISGVNHVAVLTEDLDRFVDFYGDVLGLELIFREEAPAFRHAILRCGAQSWLHPVQLPGNPHAHASSVMFERGHLDHLALTAESQDSFNEMRRRLLSGGVNHGDVEDLGAFHAFWFTDPDGMRVEIALIVDPALAAFHAPIPVKTTH